MEFHEIPLNIPWNIPLKIPWKIHGILWKNSIKTRQMFMKNFHGIFRGIQWNSMEFS
jgi:hypothetical protein